MSCSNILLPLLSIPYVSRVLDPEGIGRVGFVDSFTWYFVIIAEFGITTYGVREIARCGGDKSKLEVLVPQLLTLHIIASLLTSVVYAGFIWMLWSRFGDARLIAFSICFFAVHFFTCEWYFMGRERFKYIALRSVAIRLAGLALIFILVRTKADYYLYYAVIAGSAVLTALWNYLLLLREIPFSFRTVNWKQHLKYVWVTYLISLSYFVPMLLDNVVVGLTGTAAMVGIYSLSARIVRIGTTLLTDSFLVFFPRVVSLSAEMKHEQLVEKLSLNIQFIILLAVPLGVGLYLVSDELVLVFLGGKFAAAAVNLRILCAFPLVKGISLFLSNPVLIARHHERTALKNFGVSAIFYLVAATALSYWWGMEGACIALIITESLLMLLHFLSVKRLDLAIRFRPVTFYHALAGCVLFFPLQVALRTLLPASAFRLGVTVLLCIVLYGFVLLLLKNEMVVKIRQLITGHPKHKEFRA